VVQGTTVVESYDFEPWGLLMPGRTLGSGTKEGFTSKERDLESGLDYFGARYYMPALARWGSVDPLAEKHPEWTPYNYVLNDPLALIDPDGRQETVVPGLAVWAWRGFKTGAAAGSFGGPAVAIGIGLIETFIGATLYINEPPVPVQPVQLPDATTVAIPPILTTETAAGIDLAVLLNVESEGEPAPKPGVSQKQKEAGQQYDEIEQAQRAKRKQGRGEEIRSIKKSKQRDRGELREAAQEALEQLRKKPEGGNQ
jgi:RHS repeat-associated protein